MWYFGTKYTCNSVLGSYKWLGKISACICTLYDTTNVFGSLVPKCALVLLD